MFQCVLTIYHHLSLLFSEKTLLFNHFVVVVIVVVVIVVGEVLAIAKVGLPFPWFSS